MKKRYLPFGYVICGGEMRVDAEQAKLSAVFLKPILRETPCKKSRKL